MANPADDPTAPQSYPRCPPGHRAQTTYDTEGERFGSRRVAYLYLGNEIRLGEPMRHADLDQASRTREPGGGRLRFCLNRKLYRQRKRAA